MIDACGMITDNKQKFEEYTTGCLQKCKQMDLSCWQLLNHMQRIGDKFYMIE